MSVADLHMHTTASDGRLSPTELIDFVAGRGLKIIAVTDHDCTDGLEEAFEAARKFPELTVIPGIEFSTQVPGDEIHILGYFIQYDNQEVQEILEEARRRRLDRGRAMVEKLREMGFNIEWDRVKEIAGDGSIGRPHIALALLEKAYIANINEAFDKYIGRNKPAYVERQKISPMEAVKMINSWGGAAVLAHPVHIDDLEPVLKDLKEAGLAGMEVYYAEYSAAKIRELAEIARRYGFLPCGGSDYHAMGKPDEKLPGSMGPSLDTVKALERLSAEHALARP